MKFQGFLFSFFLIVACFALRWKYVFSFFILFFYSVKSTFQCLCGVGSYSKFRNVYFRPELFILKFRKAYFRPELLIRKFRNEYFKAELFIRKFWNAYFRPDFLILKFRNVYFRPVLSFRKFRNVYFKPAISIRIFRKTIITKFDTTGNLYFSSIISAGNYSHFWSDGF